MSGIMAVKAHNGRMVIILCDAISSEYVITIVFDVIDRVIV